MRTFVLLATLLAFAQPGFADLASIGVLGANAQGTGLDGSGVAVGMVERGRPGDPDKDMPSFYHPQVNPTQVYSGSTIDTANSQYVGGLHGQHAISVAGVMIASSNPNGAIVGMAPNAMLHAAADKLDELDVSFGVAADRIARVSGMRAINVSYGRTLGPGEGTEGNAHWTQIVDWSSNVQNVLYVVAAGEDPDESGLPEDCFNRIVAGGSQIVEGDLIDIFRQSYSGNLTDFDPPGVRTAIDLLAPGSQILVARHNNYDRHKQRNELCRAACDGGCGTIESIREHTSHRAYF